MKTTAGPLELERPRVRNASAVGFCSEIVGKNVCRTHALEALVADECAQLEVFRERVVPLLDGERTWADVGGPPAYRDL